MTEASKAGPEAAAAMAAISTSTTGAADDAHFEVLVGWSSQDFGGRIVLRTETFKGGSQPRREDLIHTHLFMTHEQATLLANYLFLLTGQSRPEPRRKKNGWFGLGR